MTQIKEGWDSNQNINLKIKTCYHGNILGILGKLNNSDDEFYIKRTFNNLPPHYSLSVSYVLWIIGTWDTGELFLNQIDNTTIYQQGSDFGSTWTYSIDYCPSQFLQSLPYPVGYKIPHTSNSLEINFLSSLDEEYKNEGLGLSRLFIYIDECSQNCLTCTGPLKSDCLDCPLNSKKIDGVCVCNDFRAAFNHVCVLNCQNEYYYDAVLKECLLKCPIQNCQICEKLKCIQCKNNYYFYNGQCYDKCPWFTVQNTNFCQDDEYDQVPRPYIVLQDMINKDFNHSQLLDNGWQLIKSMEQNDLQVSNLAAGFCNNLSIATGYKFLQLQSETCETGCGLKNNFQNLKPHYKVTIKYQIWCGDTWDTEKALLQVDGQEIDSFRTKLFTNDKENDFICGMKLTKTYPLQIFNKSNTFEHNKSSIDIQFKYILDQDTWDEWGGYREIQIYLHLCENPNCQSCEKEGKDCLTCIGVQEQQNSRILNQQCQCPQGYFDIQPFNEDCFKCDYNCLTCIEIQNNCIQCINTLNRSEAPNCMCNLGFYENEQYECKPCMQNCYMCNSIQQCSICNDGFYKNNQLQCIKCAENNCKICNNFNKCQVCEDGYYLNNITSKCLKCNYPCKLCKNQQTCKSCQNLEFRIDQIDCKCKYGYYDNQEKCLKCDENKCITCETESYICTKCKNSFYGIPDCNVQIGKFLNINYELLDCHPKCHTCRQNEHNCYQCNYLSLNRQKQFPCECLPGYVESLQYPINCVLPVENQYLNLCEKNCEICDNQTKNCILCKQSYTLQKNINNQDICQCKYNQIELQNQCHDKCQKNYYFDKQALKCFKCSVFKNNFCLKICPQNSYFNANNKQCELEKNEFYKIMYIIIIISSIILSFSYFVIKITSYIFRKLKKEKEIQFQIIQDNLKLNNKIQYPKK